MGEEFVNWREGVACTHSSFYTASQNVGCIILGMFKYDRQNNPSGTIYVHLSAAWILRKDSMKVQYPYAPPAMMQAHWPSEGNLPLHTWLGKARRGCPCMQAAAHDTVRLTSCRLICLPVLLRSRLVSGEFLRRGYHKAEIRRI